MTTREDLGTFLLRNDLTRSEELVVKWQYGLHGDFETALWGAITRADEGNLFLLARGFPEHVQAFNEWAWGSLGREIREKGLSI